MAVVGLSVVTPDGSYDERGDVIVQAALAGFFMAVLSVFLLKVSREILPSPASWIVGLGGAFGTQIWSTASRVLWGDTFFTLLVGAVVWMLVLHEKGTRKISATLLATLLAWAYFSRPTASITVLAVTIYVALHARDRFVGFALTGISWFGLFLAWSWHTFGTWLPAYYRIHSFGFDNLGTGLLGILFSPSRGQFVFVPLTLFVAYLVVRYRRSLPLSGLVTPALIATVGHVLLIGAFPLWHGGHSYGPRYLTPLVPWLVLLAALGLRALLDRRMPGTRLELGAGAILLACSVAVQARGACVRETWTWNLTPNDISLHPERVWDWRDPQFLAGLLELPQPQVVPRYPVDEGVNMAASDADRYLLSGWSGNEGAFRWTDGRAADIVFGLDRTEPLVLEMEMDPFLPPRRVRKQRVGIRLNGTTLQTLRMTQRGRTRIAVELPQARLRNENRLTLFLPDAAGSPHPSVLARTSASLAWQCIYCACAGLNSGGGHISRCSE